MLLYIPLLFLQASLAPYLPTLPPSLSLLSSPLLSRPRRDLNPSCIPVSESLQDTMERTLPLLVQKILPDIKAGKTVLVVAHANSLRGEVTRLILLRHHHYHRNHILVLFSVSVTRTSTV
jgi:broad specificity phosphatase PhoE